MKIKINEVKNGKYGLSANDNMYFNFEGENELILDKKSGLEIAWTLIDSLNLLDNDVEEFLYSIEDILNGEDK